MNPGVAEEIDLILRVLTPEEWMNLWHAFVKNHDEIKMEKTNHFDGSRSVI